MMKSRLLFLTFGVVGMIVAGQVFGQTGGPKEIPKETLEAIGPQLALSFNAEPFAPSMPDHLWMKGDPDKVLFLHFAKPVSERENKLIFIGDGIKGRFCSENQPAGGKTGLRPLSQSVGRQRT